MSDGSTYTPLMYEEIMKNSPTLKMIVEGKISEEVAKKQAEIDSLKQENQMLQQAIIELTLLIGGGM
ncbi:hypothetical protein [Petroclostridium sp. X23]|uniref:hypothetical protein n=1 Tax=Petroclostridium sp. X23 TaxID=3045146 RepID=UPI0024ACCE7C|nr:hypothetical protein [Petroclostridium sp. X23]WHH59173.1 hypothetical protein QKW49_25865 [Petroclostridium sp. X23]